MEMELVTTILQHPLTAIAVAGFIALQVHHAVRWVYQWEALATWGSAVEAAAMVYLRATGTELGQLDPVDIAQIAAAAGCPAEAAAICLRDLERRRRGRAWLWRRPGPGVLGLAIPMVHGRRHQSDGAGGRRDKRKDG
jgi:hypothetical protein